MSFAITTMYLMKMVIKKYHAIVCFITIPNCGTLTRNSQNPTTTASMKMNEANKKAIKIK